MDCINIKGDPYRLAEELNVLISLGNDIIEVQASNSAGSYLVTYLNTGPVVNSFLLMETDDFLLLENGDRIILE